VGSFTYAGNEAELAFLNAVNNHRKSENLNPVSWDGQIAFVTGRYSKIVLANGYYSPNFDGNDPVGRLLANGVQFSAVLEAGTVCELTGAKDAFGAMQKIHPELFNGDIKRIGIGIRTADTPEGRVCSWVITATD
jgi:hypothetical protein